MATYMPFTLYNPAVARENNELVSAAELKKQIVEFFKFYKPKNNVDEKIDQLLDLARDKGVLALKRNIKRRYKVSLDEADSSEVAWSRVYRKLAEFYAFYGQTKDINKIYGFARANGVFALDAKLKKLYGESLSEFMRRGLAKWKQNWRSFLHRHHSDYVSYELTRFYKFIDTRPKKFKEANPMDQLVQWACQHSRLEVNEKLLEKYNFCLDDVKMVKGTTNQERKTNLRFQLVEFYQKHDPAKLGMISHQSSEDKMTPEMKALDEEVEWGYIHYELLNQRLKNKYGEGLLDDFSSELRNRLLVFYEKMGVKKTTESIKKIIDFAKKKGLQAMNENLTLRYGEGISIEGIRL